MIFFTAFLYINQASAGLFTTKCIGKNLTVAPNPKTYTDSEGNTKDTDEWTAWKNSRNDWEEAQHYNCCENLVLNGRTCLDPSVQDTELKSCSGPGDATCSGGEGCFPLRDDDMFKADGDGQEAQAVAEKEKKYEQQQNSLGDSDPKPKGAQCYRDLECESYKCDKFQCVDNYVCREADQGEIATGAINCESPYTKDSVTGKCSDASVPFFVKGLSKVNVQQEPGRQCQFNLEGIGLDNEVVTSEKLKEITHTALKTLRGMEWLLATASGANHDECQFALQELRKRMQAFVDKRRVILKEFNTHMKVIESNNVKVLGAKKDDMAQIETLCSNNGGLNFELTTAHDVALRKASGKDFLCYMQRRNEVFKKYELDMKSWVGEVYSFVDSYKKDLKTWEEKKKDWNLFGENYEHEDRKCRDWYFFHKQIKRRWGKRYKVAGADTVNTDIVERQGAVPQYLDILEARGKLNSGRYYLLDPLLPGGYNQGISFKNYGDRRNWNGDDDRYLRNGSGYKNIFNDTKPKIENFYKSLRAGDEIPATEYIYEPELVGAYENRGCIDKLSDSKCTDFSKLINQIHEVAFAQMLAYSYHTKKKYKSFYKEEGTLRHVLLNRYRTDYTNLSLYYNALSGPGGMRDKQNACIQRVLDDLNGKDFNGQGQGITEGGNNYYNPTNTDYMGSNSNPKNYVQPKMKSNLGSPIKFNLNSLSMTMKGSTLKDGASGSSSAASGSMADGSSDALAARVKSMQEANANAAAKGIDIASKEKELSASLAGSVLGGGAGSGSASSSSQGPMSSMKHQPSSTTDEDAKNSTDGNSSNGKVNGSTGANSMNPGFGAGLNGLTSGSGSGYGSGSDGASSQSSNPSGLSDEEKDVMSANYERNKGDYKPSEDDSLFKVLSKTYMRSLDKILQRKKKGEDQGEETKPSQQ